MGQQDRDVEGRAGRSGGHWRERVDDRLILSPLFERFGERVVPKCAAAVLRDQLAGARFRTCGVTEASLGLRQQVQRAHAERVWRTRGGGHFREHVARLGQVLAATRAEQRGRVARLQLRIARARQRALVRGRRVGPAPLALVKVGKRRQQARIVGGMLLEPDDGVAGLASARVRLREHRRTVLPAGLLRDEIGEHRNRLVVLPRRHVDARQRRTHVRIAL